MTPRRARCLDLRTVFFVGVFVLVVSLGFNAVLFVTRYGNCYQCTMKENFMHFVGKCFSGLPSCLHPFMLHQTLLYTNPLWIAGSQVHRIRARLSPTANSLITYQCDHRIISSNIIKSRLTINCSSDSIAEFWSIAPCETFPHSSETVHTEPMFQKNCRDCSRM